MVGMHGAALTHLFMRPAAAFKQIVPLGTNWPAKVCYECPARTMSLVHKYGKDDDIVVKDPTAKIGSNWDILMKIYLKEQDEDEGDKSEGCGGGCGRLVLVFHFVRNQPLFNLQISQICSTTTTYSAKTTTQESLQLPIVCDRPDGRYDLCSINGSTVLDPNIFTFFTMGPAQLPQVEKVQPYPRKFEAFIMSRIKNITLTSGPQSPLCKVQHNVSALVFSAGGYTGNFFHDFDDRFVPLFITVNTIFPDQDIVIVVSEAPNWWPCRYADLLAMFDKCPIIILKNTTATHCFPAATIGLIYNT
ncbi:unnamed protein product [Malus baccata var. baccata]